MPIHPKMSDFRVEAANDINDNLAVAVGSLAFEPFEGGADVVTVGVEPVGGLFEGMVAALTCECLRQNHSDARARSDCDGFFEMVAKFFQSLLFHGLAFFRSACVLLLAVVVPACDFGDGDAEEVGGYYRLID